MILSRDARMIESEFTRVPRHLEWGTFILLSLFGRLHFCIICITKTGLAIVIGQMAVLSTIVDKRCVILYGYTAITSVSSMFMIIYECTTGLTFLAGKNHAA